MKIHKALIFYSIIALIHLGISISAHAEKDAERVKFAPKGEVIFEKKMSEFPEFDSEKFAKEAAEKLSMRKIGDTVTITYRNRKITGKLMELNRHSLVINDQKISILDVDKADLASLSQAENKRQKEVYVQKAESDHYWAKKRFERELLKKLTLTYPTFVEKVSKKIFSRINDKKEKRKYMELFEQFYHDNLPVPEKIKRKEIYLRLIKVFAQKHADTLILSGRYIHLAEEKEEEQKRINEMLEKRKKRLEDRKFRPKTAMPTFTPDGGELKPGSKLRIHCSTKNAKIHYTLDGEEPNENSDVYDDPIKLDKPYELKAIAYHPVFKDSDISRSGNLIPKGTGLFGSYFSSLEFKGQTYTRIDPKIDFKWGGGQPSIKDLSWCLTTIIWTGQIVPRHSEEYTFYFTADDGVRVWLDGKMIINGWIEQSATEYKEKVKLKAGRAYDIKIAFCEVLWAASIKFEWKSKSTPRQVVPTENLLPYGKYTDNLKKWNKVSNRKKMKNPGEYKGSYLIKMHDNDLVRRRKIYAESRIKNTKERADSVQRKKLHCQALKP